MPLRSARATAALLTLAALVGGCVTASFRPSAREKRPADAAATRPGVVRIENGRLDADYREPFAKEKAVLFARINRDRAEHGVPPVSYAPFNARVADAFCLDSALTGSIGHWDTAGRAPYLRWTLAGGVDFNGENFGSRTRIGGPLDEPMGKLLMEPHVDMMAEKPPDDGHRQTILDPMYTHVGLGAAVIGGQFRMTEEFSRRVVEWVEVPDRALAPKERAAVRFKLVAGYNVGSIEVCHEPLPAPLSLKEIARRGSYSLPPSVRRLLPRLSAAFTYPDGDRGDFDTDPSGVVSLKVPLQSGPGHYYVVVYAEKGLITNQTLRPGTMILVTAR